MAAYKKHPFENEAELCAAYIKSAERDGKWTAYPETEGWDILMVRKSDGFQIGIQAKMTFNMKVLAQCLKYTGWRDEGPDCRAVLVPTAPPDAWELCHALGLTLLEFRPDKRHTRFSESLPHEGVEYGQYWTEWCPTKRLPLPDYVPDVVAGASAPVQLTRWKQGALKVAARLFLQGYITRAEIKACGIDSSRWLRPPGCFLEPIGDGRFVPSQRMPDFEAQHPVVFPQVMAAMAIAISEEVTGA